MRNDPGLKTDERIRSENVKPISITSQTEGLGWSVVLEGFSKIESARISKKIGLQNCCENRQPYAHQGEAEY